MTVEGSQMAPTAVLDRGARGRTGATPARHGGRAAATLPPCPRGRAARCVLLALLLAGCGVDGAPRPVARETAPRETAPRETAPRETAPSETATTAPAATPTVPPAAPPAVTLAGSARAGVATAP